MKLRWWLALAGLVVIAFGVSVWLERHPSPTVEQAVLHERTAQQSRVAAQAETVFVHDTQTLRQSRVALQTVRDTLLVRLTDTVRVKAYIARVDTLLRQDSSAIADAGVVIHALHGVLDAKDAELQLALQPHPSPRLRLTVAGLYEPVAARYQASGDASVRIIGGWALLARVDAPIGEHPTVKLGVAVTF